MAPPGRSHNPRVTTPIRLTSRRFGLFPVRSPLLGESLLISVPPGTEMFHFPGLAPSPLWIQEKGSVASPQWVAPFGNPRINARSQLPEAYRSRPRPSSPPDAKASTVRPCSLDRSSHLNLTLTLSLLLSKNISGLHPAFQTANYKIFIFHSAI